MLEHKHRNSALLIRSPTFTIIDVQWHYIIFLIIFFYFNILIKELEVD